MSKKAKQAEQPTIEEIARFAKDVRHDLMLAFIKHMGLDTAFMAFSSEQFKLMQGKMECEEQTSLIV